MGRGVSERVRLLRSRDVRVCAARASRCRTPAGRSSGTGSRCRAIALQPGDLVFFGSPIHHVGIYVGGGNMIHAPNTGSSVRINSIDRSNYAGARRIL